MLRALPPAEKIEKAWFDGLIDPVEEQKKFLEAILPELQKIFAKFAEKAAKQHRVSFDPSEPAALEWINEHAFELVEQVTDTTVEQLRATLEEGWKAGEGVEGLAERIRQVFDQATRYRSFVIARTETTAAANMAQIAVMERAGVQYKQWLTGRDERVCPLCGSLDGKVVRIDEEFAPGIFSPPAHPNCRCTVLSASTVHKHLPGRHDQKSHGRRGHGRPTVIASIESGDLRQLGLSATSTKVVLRSQIRAKILRDHPDDAGYLDRISEVIEAWEYQGKSPKHPRRLERYKQLDGIWFTAVVQLAGETSDYVDNFVVTFHRLDERKVRSRYNKGRIVPRSH
ncbi:MAG TPA: minor capsid protein [Firmicutes bacterium]|nr:minor capsid protein [Bacillota bacterium]